MHACNAGGTGLDCIHAALHAGLLYGCMQAGGAGVFVLCLLLFVLFLCYDVHQLELVCLFVCLHASVG